jgi:hypothetical protein
MKYALSLKRKHRRGSYNKSGGGETGMKTGRKVYHKIMKGQLQIKTVYVQFNSYSGDDKI